MSVSSTTDRCYLTREELIERLNNGQNHKRETLKKIAKLSKIVAASIEQERATLGDENHNIVNEILMKHLTHLQKTSPPPNFSYGSNKRRKSSKKIAAECNGTHSSSDGVLVFTTHPQQHINSLQTGRLIFETTPYKQI